MADRCARERREKQKGETDEEKPLREGQTQRPGARDGGGEKGRNRLEEKKENSREKSRVKKMKEREVSSTESKKERREETEREACTRQGASAGNQGRSPSAGQLGGDSDSE